MLKVITCKCAIVRHHVMQKYRLQDSSYVHYLRAIVIMQKHGFLKHYYIYIHVMQAVIPKYKLIKDRNTQTRVHLNFHDVDTRLLKPITYKCILVKDRVTSVTFKFEKLFKEYVHNVLKFP